MIYDWNIIGHEKQLLALEQEVQTKHLTHAYLFHGPAEIGKFTLATVFAKILLCPHQLCHRCPTCQQIEKGLYPDLILLRDQGETLKIEEVRELIQKVSLTPQGAKRVVLMENIERMPLEAQNAFLKTLEEPPTDTIFLLTASEPKKILPTIFSRVRAYEFNLLPRHLLQQELQKVFPSTPELQEILAVAQGRPGMAFKFLQNPLVWSDFRAFFMKIEEFLKQNNLLAKFAWVEEAEKNEGLVEQFFETSSFLLQKALQDALNHVQNPLLQRYTMPEIDQLFEKLMKTRYLMERNVNKKLALENFFLETEK